MPLKNSLSSLWLRLTDTSGDDKKIQNPLLLALFILLAIVILAFGIFIFLDTRPNPYGKEIKIPELTKQIPDLTKEETDLILSNVYTALAANSDNKNLENQKGIIREDSVSSTYSKTTTIHSGSFIVDFPSLEQSFEVTFEYAKTDYGKNFLSGYNVVVSCLTDPQKIIYPVQTCTNISPNNTELTPDTKLITNLPYTGTTPSGDTFRIFSRHYSSGERYYEIAINSCGNQAILDEALTSAKSWIKDSLDLNPDLFTFELPTTYCPGGTH